MPLFLIDQYEIYTTAYTVEAASEAAAVAALLAGDESAIRHTGKSRYVEVATDVGMPVDEDPELAAALAALGHPMREIISSIASVESVPPTPS